MKPSADTLTRFTYALIDPRNLEIRYIGITKNIHTRLLDHIRDARNNKDTNIHKGSWIRQLLKLNLKPSIAILETCPLEDSQNSEIWWISLCKNLGFRLTNLTDGGDYPPGFDGKKHSEETKKKQSKSINAYYSKNNHPFKGQKLSPEHAKHIVEAWKKKGIYGKGFNYFVSEERAKEVYQKRSDNLNWRKNLSAAQKKRLAEDPSNNPMYGKKQSAESNEKNQLSNLMYDAYKKGNYLLLSELQESYFSIAGHYQYDYAEFSCQEF